ASVEPATRETLLSCNKATTSACLLQPRISRSTRSCASVAPARTESAHNATRIPSSSRTRRSTRTEASSAQTNNDERVIRASNPRITAVPSTSYLCHSSLPRLLLTPLDSVLVTPLTILSTRDQ